MILANAEKAKDLVKKCDAAAFDTFVRWLDGQKSVFDKDAVPVGEEQDGWVTLTKLMQVGHAMDSHRFQFVIAGTMKEFCLSRKCNFPVLDTIVFAETLIDTEVSNIWVVFANAWIHHHPPGLSLADELYYDLDTNDVRPVLSFFIVKGQTRQAATGGKYLEEPWVL